MELFRKAKVNEKLKKFHESDNYAFFEKKGLVGYELYHVVTPSAAVAYINYELIDVK